jgi:tetratricopeptide (TPR) repeat protein
MGTVCRWGMWLQCLGLLLSLSMAAGCGQEPLSGPAGLTGSPEAAGKAGPAVSDREPGSTESDITDEEARQFSERLLAVIYEGSGETVVDFQKLGERATEGIDGPPDARSGFLQGFHVGAQNLIRSIAQQVELGGDYRFLRTHVQDGERWVTMRLLQPEGGVNYHDFLLKRTPREVRAVDLHIAVTGELFSETVRRMYIQMVAHQNRSFLSRITGKSDSPLIRHLEEFSEMSQASQANPARAVQLYDTFPDDLKREKIVLVLRIIAAGSLDPGLYRQAIADLREHFPDDPATAIHSVDYYTLNEEYDAALRAIDTLDEAVGGDPFLDALRATLFGAQKDFTTAEEYLDRTLAALPDLALVYWYGVGLALEEADHEKVLHWLKRVDANIETEWEDLKTIPEYAGFVASPQHKDWLQYLEEAR